MTHTAKLAREDALTDALRVTDAAIGDEQPAPQALRIIAAIKRLRDDEPARVVSFNRVDYLDRVQIAARAAYRTVHGLGDHGSECEGIAGIDTPLGRLKAIVWRRPWKGGKHGDRIAWAGEYYLDEEPITVAEIKAAGLAQRPTTRNRKART